jgi:F-type H+-transporting ATPase subunit b
MEKTLHDLGVIILNGLPTFFLVLILAACVKYLYLKPLDKVLAERHSLTEGARKAAEDSLRNADSKIAEYEAALANARSEIYAEQSEFLRKLHDEQSERTREARAEADRRIAAAREAILKEAETARQNLSAQSDALAGEIAASIISRRAA